jgi:hypothetical protein
LGTYKKKAEEAAKKGKAGPEADYQELLYGGLKDKYGVDPRALSPTDEAAGGAHAALREELQAMRVTALQKRAASQGVDEAQIDDALDSDQPKQEMIALLLEREASTATQGGTAGQEQEQRLSEQELRHELEAQGLFALQKRWQQAGLDDAALGAALDSASPKEALIELIVKQETNEAEADTV